MTDQPTDPFSAAIADIEAKVTEFTGTVAMLKRQRALWYAERGLVPPGSAVFSAVADAAMASTASVHAVEAKNVLEGDGLAAAGVSQLETSNCPLTAREIWGALSRSGIESQTRDPSYSVFVALKRRAKDVGDVVMTGFGKWALRKWYSPSEIVELEKKWGGMGGDNRDAHAKKTSEAVRKRVERGETWGRRRTVTAEAMAKAYEAIRRGESKLAAATLAGIKHPTFAWYWCAFQMENWRPGLPFPPARRVTPLEKAPKKHEMWPRETDGATTNENDPQELDLRAVH